MQLKTEICDVALLFEDPDPKIQSLAKLFLHELNKKDTKLIFNLLPEALSRMSIQGDSDSKITKEETFHSLAKNLMPYIEKEKFSELLVEKLCYKFKYSSSRIKFH
jgi:condensin complex subunit 1